MINQITCDTSQTHSTKPTREEGYHIFKRINDRKNVPTPERFLEITCHPNGFSWTPALFSNKGQWTGTNVIALDVDDVSIPVKKATAMIENPDLRPTLMYYTFSSNEEEDLPRYRLVWLLDDTITDARRWKTIQHGIMNKIKICDWSQCKPKSFYFGGKHGKVLKHQRTSETLLFETMKSM